MKEIVEASDRSGDVAILSTLRRGEGGPDRFALSLAEAHVAGAEVDWSAYFSGNETKPVSLPTYPFQRKRYWLDPVPMAGNVSAAGLADPEHPLLGAAIDSPEDGRLQFTGKVSLSKHRWLADHAIHGVPLLTGAALVDLALSAGREAGVAAIEELTAQAPLALPESGAMQLWISLDEAGEDGRRGVVIHSRPESKAGEDTELWTCNARGTLAPLSPDAPVPPGELVASDWPPAGAEQLDIEAVYDRLADAGIDLGPAFRGLRAAWRRDGETYIEVALAEEQAGDAEHLALHPALLEAAMHVGIDLIQVNSGAGNETGGTVQPLSWRDLRLHRTGAATVRAVVDTDGEHVSLVAVDETGAPVLSLDSVAVQALEPGRLGRPGSHRSLYRVEWSPVDRIPANPIAPRLAILGEMELGDCRAERYPDLASLLEAIEAEGIAPEFVLAPAPSPPPDEARPSVLASETTDHVAELLRDWIAAEPLQGARLVLLTTVGVAARHDEDPDLRSASLRGLLQSAQAEHPDAFASIDTDGTPASTEALPAVLAIVASEPQLALREGSALMPRLARVKASAQDASGPVDPDGTILVTGGIDGFGALVARHLALHHGARHLLLLDRLGPKARGAEELRADLGELGCEATIAACDVSDRAQLQAQIAAIPAAHPLRSVIHLDGEGIGAAWYLHELTVDLPELTEFMIFSSTAGVLGGSDHAEAAADAFRDALAAHRRARDLSAVSITREGEPRLELLDAARAVDEPALLSFELDRAALRSLAQEGGLPAILSGLIPAPAQSDHRTGSLRQRLAGVAEDAREEVTIELIQEHLATLLGHVSAADVAPELSLQEMGIDSLGAVELCKRLEASTGAPVPILVLVNQPTPKALARYLLGQMEGSSANGLAPRPETTFVGLLGRAREQDTVDEFVEMLSTASRFRASFEGPSNGGSPPSVIRLAEGPEAPSLVLIPSAGPMSGPHEYVKLARGLQGKRGVFALPLPGFIAGEALPGSLRAVAETHAEAILRSEIGPDFALAGHSSGGWLAHGIASHLEGIGVHPAAVILLDTYWPQSELLNQVVPMVLAAVYDAAEENAGIDDTRLTAMGGYRRILTEWQPGKLVTPTVMVRASEPPPNVVSVDTDDWQASWELPHSVIDVPGNHMTMMGEHAASTAKAVQSALGDRARVHETEKEAIVGDGGEHSS